MYKTLEQNAKKQIFNINLFVGSFVGLHSSFSPSLRQPASVERPNAVKWSENSPSRDGKTTTRHLKKQLRVSAAATRLWFRDAREEEEDDGDDGGSFRGRKTSRKRRERKLEREAEARKWDRAVTGHCFKIRATHDNCDWRLKGLWGGSVQTTARVFVLERNGDQIWFLTLLFFDQDDFLPDTTPRGEVFIN